MGCKKIDIKKQKYFNTFLCNQKHFISHFENFYCFKIQKDNEPNVEFERLAKHMNWNKHDYLIFKERFLKYFPGAKVLQSQSAQKNNLKKRQENLRPQKNFTLKNKTNKKLDKIFC